MSDDAEADFERSFRASLERLRTRGDLEDDDDAKEASINEEIRKERLLLQQEEETARASIADLANLGPLSDREQEEIKELVNEYTDPETQDLQEDPRRRKNANGFLTDLTKEESGSVLVGGHRRVLRHDLSDDQAIAYDEILAWYQEMPRPVITVGGYAGTGKSTLVSVFASQLADDGIRVAFCAYTGKAANVLGRKLAANPELTELEFSCSTIHSLMYHAILDRATGVFSGFQKKTSLPYDLIVVDEASMIPRQLFDDLASFGIPIMAVGDHGQLPPIADKKFGRGGADDISLMLNPQVQLNTIHRQAEGNPIIELSRAIRHQTPLHELKFDGLMARRMHAFDSTDRQVLETFFQKPEDADTTAVLCGFNRTRCNLNSEIQRHLGLAPAAGAPAIGPNDRVICLKNAYFPDGFLANGSRGFVESVEPEGEHYLRAEIIHREDGVRLSGRLSRYQFGRPKTFGRYDDLPFPVRKWDQAGLLFDLGYALTVHKSQGSQYPRVVIYVERFPKSTEDEFARWLYTGVTRAETELVMIY